MFLVLGLQRQNICSSLSLITSSSNHISRLGKISRYLRCKISLYNYELVKFTKNYTEQNTAIMERTSSWFCSVSLMSGRNLTI